MYAVVVIAICVVDVVLAAQNDLANIFDPDGFTRPSGSKMFVKSFGPNDLLHEDLLGE